MHEVRPRGPDLRIAFRSDAKAEGHIIRIGGWESAGERTTKEARWYSVTLTRSTAQWAFSRGEPFRTIAALELYATLVSTMAFGDAWPKTAKGTVR